MEMKKFLSAFYAENDDVCIRVFSDRKAEDTDFKGQKYTEKLSNIENILPALKKHNERHRGVFFVVNTGGHNDEEITGVNAQFVEMDTGSFEEQQAKIRNQKCKDFIETLKQNTILQTFDEELFNSTIEKISVFEDKLIFEFKDGMEREYML